MSENDNQDNSEYENSIFFQEDNSDILWGGHINSIVIPIAEPIGEALPIPNAEPVLEPISEQVESIINNRRIRRRNEVIVHDRNKIARGENGRRIVRPRINEWNYVMLKSGETLRFTNNDGKNILLPEKEESHLLVRKILSKITECCDINDRLEYLAKFINEDVSEESDSNDDTEPPMNLKERVYQGYIKEYKLRFAFKKVWNLWQTYKLNKSYVPDIDPITISPPEKPVTIFDWKAKKKFVLDGRSLSTLIESKLKYQECGFPIPTIAKNPFTNVDFTYCQMVSIYNQLRDHGELKWGLTTLRQYDFKVNRWYQYHKSTITINAIRTNIRLLDTFEAREMLYDFICSKMEELDFICGAHILNAYKRAMAYLPNHWYLERFKQLVIAYYESEHFGTNKLRLINSNCHKLFQKQHLFIRDLHIRRII